MANRALKSKLNLGNITLVAASIVVISGCETRESAPEVRTEMDPTGYKLEIVQPSSPLKVGHKEKFQCVMKITIPERGRLPDAANVWFERMDGTEADSWGKTFKRNDPATTQNFEMGVQAPAKPGQYQLKAKADYYLDSDRGAPGSGASRPESKTVKIMAPSVRVKVE